MRRTHEGGGVSHELSGDQRYRLIGASVDNIVIRCGREPDCRRSVEPGDEPTAVGARATLLCLVSLSLRLLDAADLPRTRVEVVHPGADAVLLAVDAELATTLETRTRGLMERSSLPADQGMLFIFEVAQPLSFWMFNTLIPLDIIFADAERRITSIYGAVPPCRPPLRCPTYTSRGLAQFVLEVNAGTVAKAGIGIGDELRWKLP